MRLLPVNTIIVLAHGTEIFCDDRQLEDEREHDRDGFRLRDLLLFAEYGVVKPIIDRLAQSLGACVWIKLNFLASVKTLGTWRFLDGGLECRLHRVSRRRFGFSIDEEAIKQGLVFCEF